jgi:two-component system alkaline phosphatase synthesis response regulator PhoP
VSGEIVLVVDDEANIRDLAQMYLEKEGFRVTTAVNGQHALDQIRQQRPSLMVLDLMLPEIDGWEVCRRVRANSDLPIIMLTARDDDVDKIIGLELGADDYLTKPFNPRELVARVRAILRRSGPGKRQEKARRELGDVVIDPARHEVIAAGRQVSLRTREFELLLALADHAGLVLSREQLIDLAWEHDYYGTTRTVDVHIAQLREKLAGSRLQIETVWGKGYKLVTNS